MNDWDQKKQTFIKTEIQRTPNSWDSDIVRFFLEGKEVGHGYQGKDTQRICIERCPQCERENYAMAIATGTCSFCGFNPN